MLHTQCIGIMHLIWYAYIYIYIYSITGYSWYCTIACIPTGSSTIDFVFLSLLSLLLLLWYYLHYDYYCHSCCWYCCRCYNQVVLRVIEGDVVVHQQNVGAIAFLVVWTNKDNLSLCPSKRGQAFLVCAVEVVVHKQNGGNYGHCKHSDWSLCKQQNCFHLCLDTQTLCQAKRKQVFWGIRCRCCQVWAVSQEVRLWKWWTIKKEKW